MEKSLSTTEEELAKEQLAKAIETNNLEQVKLCLKKVNVNQFLKLRGELLWYDWASAKDTIFEETPLLYAAYKGHLEVIKLFIKNGADINKANNYGWTPLYLAV